MFSLRPDASRIAFAALCVKLDAIGMTWFDSQVLNDHTQELRCHRNFSRELPEATACDDLDRHRVSDGLGKVQMLTNLTSMIALSAERAKQGEQNRTVSNDVPTDEDE